MVDSPVSVEAIRDGLWVARMPLPFRTDPVNCYIGAGQDGGLTIVDAGLALGARGLWASVLERVDRAPSDVERVLVTHVHPDHIGGAGPLSRMTGAPVLASAVTIEQADPVWGERRSEYFAAVDRYFVRHGYPADQLAELAWEVDAAGAAVRLPDAITVVDEGDIVRFADTEWRVLAMPGHSDGHICLHSAANGEIVAGDHLLERISPAVGRYPGHAENPLALYLDSLARSAEFGDATVYPGHGRPFRGAAARAAALVEHHRARVEACLAALRDGPTTAREVSLSVFGEHLDPGNQRFALAETIAHLEFARTRGRVNRIEDDEFVRYVRV